MKKGDIIYIKKDGEGYILCPCCLSKHFYIHNVGKCAVGKTYEYQQSQNVYFSCGLILIKLNARGIVHMPCPFVPVAEMDEVNLRLHVRKLLEMTK